jgi:hypothetical protein
MMALPVCKVFFLCVAIGVGAASVEEAPGPIVQVKLVSAWRLLRETSAQGSMA